MHTTGAEKNLPVLIACKRVATPKMAINSAPSTAAKSCFPFLSRRTLLLCLVPLCTALPDDFVTATSSQSWAMIHHNEQRRHNTPQYRDQQRQQQQPASSLTTTTRISLLTFMVDCWMSQKRLGRFISPFSPAGVPSSSPANNDKCTSTEAAASMALSERDSMRHQTKNTHGRDGGSRRKRRNTGGVG